MLRLEKLYEKLKRRNLDEGDREFLNNFRGIGVVFGAVDKMF
jgi:hypothetical protein